jgi:hypothetical protein
MRVSWNQRGTIPGTRNAIAATSRPASDILINSPALGRGTGTHRKLSAWERRRDRAIHAGGGLPSIVVCWSQYGAKSWAPAVARPTLVRGRAGFP